MEKSAPDLAIVQRRMKDIVGVLENFAARREEGKDRGDYLQQVSGGEGGGRQGQGGLPAAGEWRGGGKERSNPGIYIQAGSRIHLDSALSEFMPPPPCS